MSDQQQVDATSTDTKTQDQNDDVEKVEGLGDKGKETLRKEREARRRAEEAKTQAETELAALRKEKTDREEAERVKAEEEATKKGEFERLAGERGETIKTLTGERDSLTAQIAEYEKVIGPIVDERAKALEALGDKDLIAAYPEDADSLTRMKWLDDPRLKPLLAKQADHASNLLKWPKNPNPQNTTENDAAARASQGRMYKDF